MQISKEELFSYLNCPLEYYFRYVKKIPSLQKSKDDAYKQSVISTIKSFYFTLMDGRMMTPHEIKVKWSSLWLKESKDIYEILTSQKIFKTDYERKALGTLLGFHQWAKDNCGIPIDTDREYLINIGNNKVYGKIDLVRQKFDKTIDIINFKTWETQPDEFNIENDIGITLDALAFKSIYDVMPDSSTIMVLKSTREIQTSRGQRDFEKAISVVNNVCKAIESDIIYPRWNIHCKKCQYQDLCRSWSK